MGYLMGFALALTGYALLDWGHYAVQGKRVSLWYLISGIDNSSPTSADKSGPNRTQVGWSQTPGHNVGGAGPRGH